MIMERERHDDMSITTLFGADDVVHSSAPHMTAHRFGSLGGSIARDAGPGSRGMLMQTSTDVNRVAHCVSLDPDS